VEKLPKARFSGKIAADLLCCLLGSALVALGLSLFTIPNHIAPGGVSGLATALAYVCGIPVSAWNLLLNIPLLLWALKELGGRVTLNTVLSVLLLSGFIQLLSAVPGYRDEPLLAAVFGGAFYGAGIGPLFIRGLSTGGTDLLALLLKKSFPNMREGKLLLLIDAAVVAVAVLIFRQPELALYSIVTIFTGSQVIDALSEGVDHAKVIFAVTDYGTELAGVLGRETPRGATILPATGGYTLGSKALVISVTRRNALYQTLRLIKQTDPAAFTFVVNSTEVHGEGFITD